MPAKAARDVAAPTAAAPTAAAPTGVAPTGVAPALFSRGVLASAVLALAVAALGTVAACAPGPPVARTEAGPVRGARVGGDVVAFLGVAYASPPVGPLRWRPPEPPEPWGGTRDATAYGPACPQGDGTAAYYRRAARRLGRDTMAVPALGRTSEDCLYLNVWAPADPARPLPVLVWVHGGAGTGGTGADPLFAGDALARRGLVVITLNYRLGALGFLAHPALSADDPRGVSGNYALHDLVRALEWVRENAGAFGGDPDRVTLAGQSSGGTLVETLMVVPRARGLFHRVASHSATWVGPPPLRGGDPGDPGNGGGADDATDDGTGEPTTAEAAGVRFLRALGIGPDAAAAALRSVPADSLVAAAGRVGAVPATPVVDGVLLPDRPDRLWARGEVARVPLLKGSTDDEFALLVPPDPVEPADYRAWVRAAYDTLADAALAAHPAGPDAESSRRQRVRLLSDQVFAAPALLLVAWMEGEAPVWLYRFAWRPDDGAVGAFHGVDLPFLFDTHGAAGFRDADPEAARLTAAVQAAWARFAATGRPAAAPLPPWPPALPDSPRVMVLDGTPGVEPFPALDFVRAVARDLVPDPDLVPGLAAERSNPDAEAP